MLSVPLFPVVIIGLLFLAGVYSTRKKRGQIFCWFEGEDGTDEFKWVKDTEGWVIFRRYKFKIMPERMSSIWISGGIHWLFPTRAQCLKYSWSSQYPRDPKNFGRTIISPQVKKIINKSETVESYFKTSSPGAKQKQSTLMQYLPLISIILVVLVGYFLYSNMQNLAMGLNALQQQINTIAR